MNYLLERLAISPIQKKQKYLPFYDLWSRSMENFFGKIQKSDLQQPPKFKQTALPKFGATASQNSDKQFFVKFVFYS